MSSIDWTTVDKPHTAGVQYRPISISSSATLVQKRSPVSGHRSVLKSVQRRASFLVIFFLPTSETRDTYNRPTRFIGTRHFLYTKYGGYDREGLTNRPNVHAPICEKVVQNTAQQKKIRAVCIQLFLFFFLQSFEKVVCTKFY